MAVLISIHPETLPVDANRLEKKAKAVLEAMARPESELSLTVVDDAGMRDLNREWRDKDAPTNVLAFAMREGGFGHISPHLLGDVVISLDTALREAAELGVTPEERLDDLMVHGILHLLGYDHERSEADEEEMMAKSAELAGLIRGIT